MQPRAEGPAAVEAVERAHGGEEGLLGDVLGGGRVVHHEPRRPMGARPMAAEELGEGLGRAALRGAARAPARTRAPTPGAGRRRAASAGRPSARPRSSHGPLPSSRARLPGRPCHIRTVQPSSCRPIRTPTAAACAAGLAPGLPAPQRDASRARGGPEQPRRRLADLRLGKPRPALLQRRPAVLPHPSGLDRRLDPRQPRQARGRAAIRPTSRRSSPSPGWSWA